MPGAGGQPPQRTTFRPPWVKDGPSPLPMPSAPWALNSRRDSKPKVEEPPPFTQVTLKVSSFLSFSHSPISCHTRVRYLKICFNHIWGYFEGTMRQQLLAETTQFEFIRI